MITRADLHVTWDNRLGMIAYVANERRAAAVMQVNVLDVILLAANRGGIYAR